MKNILILGLLTIILSSCPSAGAIASDEMEPELPVFTGSSGETYYVASQGDDDDDGLSPSSPWRTIEKLNSRLYEFQPGDTILFKRDDEFKGNLEPASGTEENWIRYGAYGNGKKPLLTGSLSLNLENDWSPYRDNIWRSAEPIDHDIGALYMDGDHTEIGERKWSLENLKDNGDFYKDPAEQDKYLYLYCQSGSPAIHYSGIEAAIREHIINLDERSYVLFENLHLSRGAAHGFGGSDTEFIIIRNCEFSFIGGGYLYSNGTDPVRYGNAIEFWGNAENNLVEGNLFYEIYDTAVTNQNHSRRSIQRNLFYINNIMFNCGLASFELWNRPSTSLMENIYFIHNTSINPGYGWGGALHRSDKNSFHVASYYNEASGKNLIIKNNIFYTSQTPPGAEYHLFFFDEDVRSGMSKYIIDNNIWHMPAPLWSVTKSKQYSNLEEWSIATGQSSHGLSEDPRIVDFSNRDFNLMKNSPALNSGTETLRLTDFKGKPNKGLPDMGALELQY